MEKILLELFTKKSYKKHHKELRIEKVIKRKVNKLYVKWKGHDYPFNGRIDKERYYYIK